MSVITDSILIAIKTILETQGNYMHTNWFLGVEPSLLKQNLQKKTRIEGTITLGS